MRHCSAYCSRASPYAWHTRNDIARYEGYYASVFYSYFAGAGLDIVVEDNTSLGRVDMAVRFNRCVYLVEFKVVDSAPVGTAMAQLEAMGYADKYRGSDQPIWLIAVEFSKTTRNLAAFEGGAGRCVMRGVFIVMSPPPVLLFLNDHRKRADDGLRGPRTGCVGE